MPTVPAGTNLPPSTYPTTGSRFCSIHGNYFGATCPGCNASSLAFPQPQRNPHLPARYEEIVLTERIAAALERIAEALEAHKP